MPPRPIRTLFLPVAVALLVSACAGLPEAEAPRVPRLTDDEAGRLTRQALPSEMLEALVAQARAGAAPDELLAAWRAGGARFAPTPSQIVELHARGVPLAALEAMAEAHDARWREEVARLLAARDEACAQALAAERWRARAPFDPFLFPWGGYRHPLPGWRIPYCR